eukprot:CAMPEP_0197938386 /NCGR_PEP_ID=MMETSP1439-20131203/118051_1 /TAXON_ID=66791 /ORGANISM="Gonyaulax spinifera, Strain CCMP409" /LENGTH=42 /DNA_ID= /DNA_START= /DNA_END= /DNA_ORIENTATION=
MPASERALSLWWKSLKTWARVSAAPASMLLWKNSEVLDTAQR